ncbi:MAG: hypothetical protein ACLS8R_01505 [Anaeromassilibacillus sp.]
MGQGVYPLRPGGRRFYETIGYHAKGEIYLDEYCPHVTMTKPAGEENQEERS